MIETQTFFCREKQLAQKQNIVIEKSIVIGINVCSRWSKFLENDW